MKPYADTNFFTRVYLDLPESAAADRLMATARDGETPPLPVTWLHRLELVNAFELSVWLGKQGGHPVVTAQQAAVAIVTFSEDVRAGEFLRFVRPDLVALGSMFEEMAQRHTARHGFRTYDIMHVASARLLGCNHFFSFDQRACKLAALEGFTVSA